ncbi:Rab-GTPase-TBC domain [Macleaya cordata]|uniref:Rab-GTPase-TBC domain n=1 Tax=Macleaya cordata TaxID=56857 RepID=A0A200R938_MACCD|nr:Rab-GTPase-TBC domain [Macleaya cordata]
MGCCEGIQMKNSKPGDSDSFCEIRAECTDDVPKSRFKPRLGQTLSVRKWNSAFSEDGHLDMAKVLSRIQRGGVHPSIRGVVWEFLLACYDPDSTFEERNQLRQRRREQYGKLKTECQKMELTIGSGKYITMPIISEDGQPIPDPSNNSDDSEHNGAIAAITLNASPKLEESVTEASPEKEVIQWKLGLHQIGLDVIRTDRALVFYESEANLAKLWDILAVYAWVDKDIGYCQAGMSDLCSPMVILLENEADAFWCFERLMRRVRGNFKCTKSSIGVQSQLSTLAAIVKVVDPKLHRHLEDLDGGQYLFAFRMLMVLFRREFSVVDAMYLWELMWAMEYNPNSFAIYEELSEATNKCITLPKGNDKLLKMYGKFERKKVKIGSEDSLSVFLVASVLEARNKRLLREAKGLDDVVKILNDISGNLDAKKACKEALKVHKKYLNKLKKS